MERLAKRRFLVDSSVYVARDWRRRGLYRLLYRHIEQLAAQDENVCGFRLYVERENHVAQKTYTALE